MSIETTQGVDAASRPSRCSSAICPALQMKDGSTVYPTNIEWLMAFAIKGCQWAIDALPEAIRVAELQRCETYNGGCI